MVQILLEVLLSMTMLIMCLRLARALRLMPLRHPPQSMLLEFWILTSPRQPITIAALTLIIPGAIPPWEPKATDITRLLTDQTVAPTHFTEYTRTITIHSVALL